MRTRASGNVLVDERELDYAVLPREGRLECAVPEAQLKDSGSGLAPATEGWFVVNVRDAEWWFADSRGARCSFESEYGEPAVSSHSSGSTSPYWSQDRAASITQSPLRKRSSCSPGSAGCSSRARSDAFCPGTSSIRLRGQSTPSWARATGHVPPDGRCAFGPEARYPVSELAARYGASVEEETSDPAQVYARSSGSAESDRGTGLASPGPSLRLVRRSDRQGVPPALSPIASGNVPVCRRLRVLPGPCADEVPPHERPTRPGVRSARRGLLLGRATWPPEMLNGIDAECVLDLAAGTGKLTALLAERFASVVAVEPLPEMRAVLQRNVPEVRAVTGTAERIPLDDALVDAVFVADAFHWFDSALAAHEIERVLRPRGVARGLLQRVASRLPTRPRAEALALVEEVGSRVPPPGGVKIQSGLWRRGLKAFEPLEELALDHDWVTDAEGGRLLRVSQLNGIVAAGRANSPSPATRRPAPRRAPPPRPDDTGLQGAAYRRLTASFRLVSGSCRAASAPMSPARR